MMAGPAEPSPPLSTMAVPDVEYIVPPHGSQNALDDSSASPRALRKHKPLPRTRNGSLTGSSSGGTPDSRGSGSGSQSLHILRHQRRKISGGELPPTPPAHSRTSSSSHSVSISNLSPLQTPAQSSEDVLSNPNPTTPPNQRSPPTPEVTPPRPKNRGRISNLRPTLYDRVPSKSTTDSRTESFKTALESPEQSDEEDNRSTLRPAASSAGASRAALDQVNGYRKRAHIRTNSGSGARPSPPGEFDDLTPTPKGDFNSFDGEWQAGSEVEQEWDDNLARNVTVRKRRQETSVEEERREGLDDVTPTNAARAPRTVPLQGRVLTYDSREPPRSFTAPQTATAGTATTGGDTRRLSGMSSRSAASTIVEAILVETTTPRRHKTLRHVKRIDALRDSVWQPSPLSSAPSLADNVAHRRPTYPAPRDSYASTSTTNSVSSRKARREVWKNGGIPVVVVPDRQSSNRSSSRDHSLQSASSQRSKHSQSITSIPASHTPMRPEQTAHFDRPSGQNRRSSESDGSMPDNQRTIDYPPAVPRRTSSSSAPISRNGSREASRNDFRAGSLTSESLKAHNESVAAIEAPQPSDRAPAEPPSSRSGPPVPLLAEHSVASHDYFVPVHEQIEPNGNQGETDDRRYTVDTQVGSPLLSTLATPFSQTSVETALTAAEIAQAMAVSIMPHKNRSVLVVDHRPSDSLDGERRARETERPQRPIITTTEVDGVTEEQPVTPPQEHPPLSLDEIDSPLRNPRAPPEPPVLQFIPATPSGLTPAEEKPRLLGNFYEETKDKPSRGLAMVRRALGQRRHSSSDPSPSREARPGFLARRLSLSKTIRKERAENPELDYDVDAMLDGEPRDESRLHPDWRPSYHPGFYDGDSDGVYDVDNNEEEMVMRYPMIDNRPRPPKRSLSQRMKRTFAIMPLQDDDDVYGGDDGPDRRTVRRSPSGNLRVVRHGDSMGSLRRQQRQREDTDLENRRVPFFPRSYSLVKGSRGRRHSEEDLQRNGLKRTWSLTQSVQGIPRRFSEKRREKRSDELRQKISGPRDVRDGVDDVIRRDGLHEALSHPRRAEDVTRSRI